MNKVHYRSVGIASGAGDSPFAEAVSVDAWDAWFRWRNHGTLRDLTVDDTWDRVASTLASVESGKCAVLWKTRFADAFAAWQLLLDERILATAGTERGAWSGDGLVAVLNAASFVRAPWTLQASFDQAAFEELAALAVRALDDAAVLAGSHALVEGGFRIGIVGLVDAFALLGLDYDSSGAHALARLVAQTLARGCHRSAAELNRDRGALAPCTQAWRAHALAQDIAPEIVAEAERAGIRHGQLTAVTSQPKLALFANDITDAIDPFVDAARAGKVAGRDTSRGGPSRSTVATAPGDQPRLTQGSAAVCTALVPAQLSLRAAMQNWIDEPIHYPLLVDNEPDAQLAAQWATLAAELGLPRIAWRKPSHHTR